MEPGASPSIEVTAAVQTVEEQILKREETSRPLRRTRRVLALALLERVSVTVTGSELWTVLAEGAVMVTSD